MWSNPEKKRLNVGSFLPLLETLKIEEREKPRLLMITDPLDNEMQDGKEKEVKKESIFELSKNKTDISKVQKNPKSELKSINHLQLTVKNLPKNMDLNSIYAEDLNIISYFDNVASKSVDEWRVAMKRNIKFKVYLKAFLQILFKQNKEK